MSSECCKHLLCVSEERYFHPESEGKDVSFKSFSILIYMSTFRPVITMCVSVCVRAHARACVCTCVFVCVV